MSGGRIDWTDIDGGVGRELGVSDWIAVERAKRESPLGSTIAHGFLTLSLLARFGYELGLVRRGP